MNKSEISHGLREPAATVACGVCHREIPLSTALWRESSDYVAHFCGLDCFARWRHQEAQ